APDPVQEAPALARRGSAKTVWGTARLPRAARDRHHAVQKQNGGQRPPRQKPAGKTCRTSKFQGTASRQSARGEPGSFAFYSPKKLWLLKRRLSSGAAICGVVSVSGCCCLCTGVELPGGAGGIGSGIGRAGVVDSDAEIGRVRRGKFWVCLRHDAGGLLGWNSGVGAGAALRRIRFCDC